MRVADYMIDFVNKKLGVETIFLVSGGGIMHLTDAIACNEEVNYACSHNEQATTMEADGYAKIKGGFGVALVTTGPGATNAITGAVGAWQDSSKVFVISGQSNIKQTIYNTGLEELRQFGAQEAHVLPMVKSFTKYSAMVDDPAKIRYHLEKAAFLAGYGRPGPVWLDVPLNVQGAVIDREELVGFDPEAEGYSPITKTQVKSADVEAVLEMVENAERPLIIAGQGVRIAGAVDDLNSMVEKLNIPVITPRLGIDLMDSNNPLYIGRPGVKGNRAGNLAMQNADLILAIGTRLSITVVGYDYDKFAREAKLVVVDVDPVEHKKPTVKIDRFVEADGREFILSMTDMALKKSVVKDDAWPSKCRSWKEKYPVVLDEYRHQKDLVNTYYFTEVLSKYLNEEDIIIIDSGSSSYIVSQAIDIKYGQRYLASGGLGAMGYALPAAIGASIASNKGRVICITGDGSLQMNVQELLTVVHENLPIKVIVYNNHGYSSIRATQENYFEGRFIGVDKESGVPLPDIIKTADLYGMKGIRIENSDEVEDGVRRLFASDKPVLCDVVCSQRQPVIPTLHSKKLDDGTMVSMPLEDMYPFLDREDFKREMIVKPLPESE